MAETASKMIDLGSKARDFSLPDAISGKNISLEEMRSEKATVIMFICNHCPFVKHVNEQLVKLAEEYIQKGFSFIAISSNDAENYPEDSFEKMKEYAENLGYPFPYLYDESQAIAMAYGAACTPDFFIYNNAMELIYRGQLDSSRPGNTIPVTGKDIRAVLDAVNDGQPIPDVQIPSIGCNIKWK